MFMLPRKTAVDFTIIKDILVDQEVRMYVMCLYSLG